MLQATLLFGLNGGHGRIGTAAWRRFLEREITPRFPDGLTIFDANGQWRDPRTGHIAREPSKIVLIVAPNEPAAYGRLKAIADIYKRRFAQHSVGIVTSAVCASF
jgi:hypothetical protein